MAEKQSELGAHLSRTLQEWRNPEYYIDVTVFSLQRYLQGLVTQGVFSQQATALDLGCGVYRSPSESKETHEPDRGPQFCQELARGGWVVTGVDQKPLRRVAPEEWTFLQGNVKTGAFWQRHFQEDHFDLVSAQHLIALSHPADVSPSLVLSGGQKPYHLADLTPGFHVDGSRSLQSSPAYVRFVDRLFAQVHRVLKTGGVFFVSGQSARHLFVKEGQHFVSLLPQQSSELRPSLVVEQG